MKRAQPVVCLATLFSCLALAAQAAEPAAIRRTIDASGYFRSFPDLAGYWNTSIQKAPAPALAARATKEFGKSRITRCWVNLDELWDYRTRTYTDNYQIGVHKYDGVPEKAVESWGWVTPTRVRFDDYLKAFGAQSHAILLCVRRYERDVLDGKLGVTFDDWKAAFKRAVIHARRICPNVRYIEVCNEYACFIRCTPKEYYQFYRRAYEAVNEANRELGLSGDDRLLVGGPNVVRDPIGAMNRFFDDFRDDSAPDKKLDFVTWHEYHNRYAETAHREKQVRGMLAARGLPEGLPLFITEHDPFHPKGNAPEYNLINGAALVKSLYFTSLFSPGVKIMPWVLYHNDQIQTRFMWFAGPNEPDTKGDELRLLPAGCSIKLLSMHKPWEIAVDNAIDRDEIVLASVGRDGLAAEVVNYGPPRDVSLRIENLPKVFSALGAGQVTVVEYLVDQDHSNCLTRPGGRGGIEQVSQRQVQPADGVLTLVHRELANNGIVFWEVTPAKTGAELPPPK